MTMESRPLTTGGDAAHQFKLFIIRRVGTTEKRQPASNSAVTMAEVALTGMDRTQ